MSQSPLPHIHVCPEPTLTCATSHQGGLGCLQAQLTTHPQQYSPEASQLEAHSQFPYSRLLCLLKSISPRGAQASYWSQPLPDSLQLLLIPWSLAPQLMPHISLSSFSLPEGFSSWPLAPPPDPHSSHNPATSRVLTLGSLTGLSSQYVTPMSPRQQLQIL